MRRSDLVQYKEKENGRIGRTSQIVFGERQHLLRVLDSLEGTSLPIARMQQERRMLEELIHARTRELNHINTAWDEKIRTQFRSLNLADETFEFLVLRYDALKYFSFPYPSAFMTIHKSDLARTVRPCYLTVSACSF